MTQARTIPTCTLRIAIAPLAEPVVVGVEVVDSAGQLVAVLRREEVMKAAGIISEHAKHPDLKEIDDWNYLQMGN